MSDSLSFATQIDTSGFDEALSHMEQTADNLTKVVETQSARIGESLTNIPSIDFAKIADTSSLDKVDVAFQEIDRVIGENQQCIDELQAKYEDLGQKAQEALQKGTADGDEQYRAYMRQRDAIEQVVSAHKKVIAAAGQQSDALQKVEQKLKSNSNETTKNEQKQVSLRQKLRELKNELTELEMAGQRNTQAYRDVQKEAARLTDALADAQTQANILANDQAGFKGVLSGLSGVAGGFAAAQGAMALFGEQNKELQEIMLRVQSLMAITNGLQQVSAMLNKDSAFSLVTLNALKSVWNKLMGESAAVEEEETAATASNTSAKVAQTEATTLGTEAKTLETTADVANTEAEVANTTAKGVNTKATQSGTAATASHTAGVVAETSATTASTVATKAATIAMKGLRMALMSTGIGALIVALGYLVSYLMDVFAATSKAAQEAKEMNEINREGRKIYAENKATIEHYTKRIKEFNGTREEERKLVKELNSKYGEQIGYHNDLAGWENALIKKSPAYLKMLQTKAEAQALLNKYTDAYVQLQEMINDPDLGKAFWRMKAQEQRAAQKEIDKQRAEMNKWLAQYEAKISKVESLQTENDFGGHTDPNANKQNTFDAKGAARAYKEAYKRYTDAVERIIKQANSEVTAANIQYMQEGLQKQLMESDRNFQQLIDNWKENYLELARVRKEAAKANYMQTQGHTEESWEKTAEGHMSDNDWLEVVFKENEAMHKQYQDHLTRLTEEGERARNAIAQQYTEQMVQMYGTAQQKIDALEAQRIRLYNTVPAEFLDEAERQIDEQIAKLETEKFKAEISWDIVFGDTSQQSMDVLKYNLERIQKYFEANKESMSIEEVKEYQDAIIKLQDAIGERNPFGMLHQSLKDIGDYKEEFTTACNEYAVASAELTDAQNAYNEALALQQELDEQRDEDGNIIQERQEGYAEAVNATAIALQHLSKAETNAQKAEQRVFNSRNNITVAYRRFANSLGSINTMMQGLGNTAQNMAEIFSSDVAASIGKVLDTTNEVFEATQQILISLGDLGKSVANGVEGAVQATADGAKTAALAGATAISTIEKASVILAVISAAMQIATAIINLFNNDDDKQKEIERLQKRIDQLQWELDNPETVRLQERTGRAIDNLNRIYNECYNSFARLHGITKESAWWERWYFNARYSADIYAKTVEKIADYYAQANYTADKLLGKQKWSDSRKQLDAYAEQMVLIRKQINEENSKKKKDQSKIDEYYQKIEELGQKMADVINNMLEEIIGSSAEDLATTLGNAFVEAAQQGEDAMKAWGDKTKEIVGDILKRMLITKMLEEPLGDVLNKYKKKWFGEDGQFRGIDTIINSMEEFAGDINAIGNSFGQFWDTLPAEVKQWFSDDDREASKRGIATASQDSVDENNARLTTIQGHTYTLVQGMAELNATGSAILERVTGIERNTAEANDKLDEVKQSVKIIKDSVDTIQTQGLKLKV